MATINEHVGVGDICYQCGEWITGGGWGFPMLCDECESSESCEGVDYLKGGEVDE